MLLRNTAVIDSARIRFCMCGRYGLDLVGTSLAERLIAALNLEPDRSIDTFKPNFNIKPTNTVPIATSRGLQLSRWGAPHPTKSTTVFNARDDTVHHLGMHAIGFQSGRAIMPVSHFFEPNENGEREPWVFFSKSRPLLLVAAISWAIKREQVTVMVTTSPNETVMPIHGRMPAILDEAAAREWIDPSTNLTRARALLRPAPGNVLETYAVSRDAWRKKDRTDKGLLDPVEPDRGLFDDLV